MYCLLLIEIGLFTSDLDTVVYFLLSHEYLV